MSVKQRPLLMKPDMVRATLDGIKVVTRRLDLRWLKAESGSLIWVKEGWRTKHLYDGAPPRAVPPDAKIYYVADEVDGSGLIKRSSLFMPKWASRIWLEVVSVREERVQDITEDDAKCEGARFHDGRGVGHSGWRLDYKEVYPTARDAFFGLWVTIHGEPSLRSNPLVARIEFKRIERPSPEAPCSP